MGLEQGGLEQDRGEHDGGVADPLEDQAEAARQQAEGSAEIATRMALLTDIEELWVALIGPIDPVTKERQLEALAHRVGELLDATVDADLVHPMEGVLAPLVARMPTIEGVWRLETEAAGTHRPEMELVGAYASLPDLPLPTFGVDEQELEASAQHLGVRLDLNVHLDPGVSVIPDFVHVTLLGDTVGDAPTTQVGGRYPSLRAEVGTTLERALASATYLSRCAPPDRRWQTRTEVQHDRDPEAARLADRLVELLAGLEHALARQDAGRRNPDRTSDADAEVAYRQSLVFASAEDVTVHLIHRLPANTLEPSRLRMRVATGLGPDRSDLLPATFLLELDLSDGRRGAGMLETDDWRGKAQRAVLLPHVVEQWTEYVDSAVARANVRTRGLRRPIRDEVVSPIDEVPMPVGRDVSRMWNTF